jgi:hypothetical protein
MPDFGTAAFIREELDGSPVHPRGDEEEAGAKAA